MKKVRIWVLLCVITAVALLTACSRTAAVETAGTAKLPQPVQAVKSVQNISRDEALNAVKHTIILDYRKYRVDLINEDLTYDGKDYYQFLISDSRISLEPSVIVSKDNGEILCYYPDQSVTEVYQDDVFKSKC